jgi:hypothetical protein
MSNVRLISSISSARSGEIPFASICPSEGIRRPTAVVVITKSRRLDSMSALIRFHSLLILLLLEFFRYSPG